MVSNKHHAGQGMKKKNGRDHIEFGQIIMEKNINLYKINCSFIMFYFWEKSKLKKLKRANPTATPSC